MTFTCQLSQRPPPSLSCMLLLRAETYLREPLSHRVTSWSSPFDFCLHLSSSQQQDPISKRSTILSSIPSFPKAPPKTFLSCTLRTKAPIHCEENRNMEMSWEVLWSLTGSCVADLLPSPNQAGQMSETHSWTQPCEVSEFQGPMKVSRGFREEEKSSHRESQAH